jgi:hypothetical protein
MVVEIVYHPPHSFQDFKHWVSNRLGGKWAANEATSGRRPITVTKEYLHQLYFENGGSWCRAFGVRGSWRENSRNLLSMDKIDTTKGYEPVNLMIVLWAANRGRNVYPWPDFRGRGIMDGTFKLPIGSRV